jgi:hypothetical protein
MEIVQTVRDPLLVRREEVAVVVHGRGDVLVAVGPSPVDRRCGVARPLAGRSAEARPCSRLPHGDLTVAPFLEIHGWGKREVRGIGGSVRSEAAEHPSRERPLDLGWLVVVFPPGPPLFGRAERGPGDSLQKALRVGVVSVQKCNEMGNERIERTR